MTLTLDFQGQMFNSHILGKGMSIDLEWKRCELDTMLDVQWACSLGHSAWQKDRPSNGSMWNSYSFQPIGSWMGYSFTDLGAEGCCRSLNALLWWAVLCQGPLLQTWINFNPSMDKESHAQWYVRWNYLSIPKLQRCNRWSLGMDKWFNLTLYNGCNYLSMLGSKLNHVTERNPRKLGYACLTRGLVIGYGVGDLCQYWFR